MTGRAGGLLIAAHPLPAFAVTAFATSYVAVLGAGPGRLALVVAAVVAGQLCVGWSNDALDAGRDRVAARADKPVAAGALDRRPVAAAAVLAGLACVPLSLALGVAPGLLHLVAVGAALAYNLGLKATPASPLPYLLAFGLLPVVATLATGPAGDGIPVPQPVAAALLGAGAHFSNTVGDAAADALTGVRGLPQRLGPRRSLVVTAVLVAAGSLVLLADVAAGITASGRDVAGAVLLTAGALLAAAGAVGGVGTGGGRTAFRLTLGAVSLVVLGFLVTA